MAHRRARFRCPVVPSLGLSVSNGTHERAAWSAQRPERSLTCRSTGEQRRHETICKAPGDFPRTHSCSLSSWPDADSLPCSLPSSMLSRRGDCACSIREHCIEAQRRGNWEWDRSCTCRAVTSVCGRRIESSWKTAAVSAPEALVEGVSLRPSCPCVFAPHTKTSPSVVLATKCDSPPDTIRNSTPLQPQLGEFALFVQRPVGYVPVKQGSEFMGGRELKSPYLVRKFIAFNRQPPENALWLRWRSP